MPHPSTTPPIAALSGIWRRRFPLSLVVALALYGLLLAHTASALGLVGEVALGWGLDAPPRVLVSLEPPLWADGATPPSAGHVAGPLVASQVRPLERLVLGPLSLPIAINRYTGGLPDWPARLLFLLTGSIAAVQVLHGLLGAGILWLTHRLLRLHGTDIAAAVAVLVLACDWGFLFYRRALGGTELALQAALLLCLWAAWSRRWGSGRHGLWALALAAGVGLLAKLTFVLPLAGLLLALALTRWDHPATRPPDDARWPRALLALALTTAPLWLTALHHLALPAAPRVQSHDFPGLQWERVVGALTGQRTPTREALGNLEVWALEPLAFFRQAYGATDAAAQAGPSPWRLLGWLLVGLGSLLAWRDRHPTPKTALLRLLSLALPLQIGALWLAARDLHHLAMLAPLVAAWFGLAAEHLCALVTPPRSFARARLALLLALPWMLAGSRDALSTDAVLSTIAVPTFTAAGQQALVELLRAHHVQHLTACDYELYGLIELIAPDIEVTHAWGAASREHGAILPDLLRRAAGASAEGGHLIVLQPSAPMIYNLRPSGGQLKALGAELGLEVEEVGRLPEKAAVLYRVRLRSPGGAP